MKKISLITGLSLILLTNVALAGDIPQITSWVAPFSTNVKFNCVDEFGPWSRTTSLDGEMVVVKDDGDIIRILLVADWITIEFNHVALVSTKQRGVKTGIATGQFYGGTVDQFYINYVDFILNKNKITGKFAIAGEDCVGRGNLNVELE
jgi:hypothetical protein